MTSSEQSASGTSCGEATGGPSDFRFVRRWSLDDLESDSPAEGYVRDLRKVHDDKAAAALLHGQKRDEGYPFTLTERHAALRRSGSLGPTRSAGIVAKEDGSVRSLSLPSSCAAERKRGRSCSPDEDRLSRLSVSLPPPPQRRQFAKLFSSSSTDISTSVVPEDIEVSPQVSSSWRRSSSTIVPESRMAAARTRQGRAEECLRKRSNSLPRVLPPIPDVDAAATDDDADAAAATDATNGNHQRTQTSNIIVREMQKFVRRNAIDVSQVLPLPLPTNVRQSVMLADWSCGGGGGNSPLDVCHAKLLLSSVAKIHAVSFAVKCKSPRLFDDIEESLRDDHRRISFSSGSSVLERAKDLLRQSLAMCRGNDDEKLLDLERRIVRQTEDLISPASNAPFSLLVHGNLRPASVTFRYSCGGGGGGNSGEAVPINAKLPNLTSALIASPLVDIFSVLHNCTDADEAARNKESLLFAYHSSFVQVCNLLRVKVSDFGRQRLDDDVNKYDVAGMVLAVVTASEEPPGKQHQQQRRQSVTKSLLAEKLKVLAGRSRPDPDPIPN